MSSLVFCLLYSPAITTICNHWEHQSLDYTDLVRQSNVSALQHNFPAKKQLSSDFMAAVTIHSDFGVQEEEICHYFTFSPSICYAVMGADTMILDCFSI